MFDAENQNVAATGLASAQPEAAVVDVLPMPFLAGSESVLEAITRLAARTLNAHGAGLSVTTAGRDHLFIASGVVRRAQKRARSTPFVQFSPADTDALVRAQPFARSRAELPALEGAEGWGVVHSLLVAPVQADHAGRVGALAVAAAKPRTWTADEQRTLQGFAALAASLIDRLRRSALDRVEMENRAAWLRRSFDDAIAGHAVTDAAGRIKVCNAEFARIAGLRSPEDAVGSTIYQIQSDHVVLQSMMRQLHEHPAVPLQQELQIGGANRVRLRVTLKLTATVQPDGTIAEIRVYLLDVTQNFLDQEILRQSHERLELLELATNDVLWEWDLATGQLAWNEAVARRFRYTTAEVRSSIDWHEERVHPEDRERVIRGLERAILGVENSWADEYRFQRGDGTYATVFDRAYVVRNDRSEPQRVIGWMLDVTERKEAEELQRFLARMSRVLESTMEVETTALNFANLSVPVLADVCAVDIVQPDGKLERLAAVHRKPELQDKLNRGNVIDPDNSEATALLGVARTRSSLFEPELRGSANVERGVTLGFEPGTGVRSHLILPIEARDRLLGVVSLGMTDSRRSFAPLNLLIAKDVVQRLAVAADKALLYETTRRAVMARDEILSLVSHDLRVPLNTIMAVTNLLSDHKQDRRSDVDYWLETLNRASEQIRVQIDDLLDVSRIEANRFAVDSVPEMPKALLSEACDLLRPIAARKEIELICDLEGDFPPVHADAPQIVRVLNNLISNAIKFCSPGGRIRLSASVRYDEVWISVEDTGSGIPADEIERVFDRFWKGRPGDRRGAGLGLTIAKGVIEAHSGRIWVESKPGVGSTFTFSLPTVPRFAAEGSGARA